MNDLPEQKRLYRDLWLLAFMVGVPTLWWIANEVLPRVWQVMTGG